jgi:hypothetical protein
MARKPHSLTGKLIDIRRLDFSLAITSQLPVPEIIGHDINNVGWNAFFFARFPLAGKKAQQRNYIKS